MKKAVSLLLIAAVVLSLCACGTGNQTIYWGEPIQSDGWEFTVTNIEFREQYSYNNTNYSAKDGSIFLGIEYTLKNISKQKKNFVPEDEIKLDYDGYSFELDRYFRFSNGGWVSSWEEQAPLSEATVTHAYFEVPSEVKDETDKNLKIIINLGTPYTFNIRPLDEKSLQGKYNQAVEQIEQEDYSFAIEKLEELGDYKDSKAQLEIANEAYLFYKAGFEESIKYFTENREKYEKIPASQIPNLSGNKWAFSKYGIPVLFKENGELYNSDIRHEDIHWSVEDDNLVIDKRKYNQTEKFEIRKFSEGKYLLYTNEEFKYTLKKLH